MKWHNPSSDLNELVMKDECSSPLTVHCNRSAIGQQPSASVDSQAEHCLPAFPLDWKLMLTADN